MMLRAVYLVLLRLHPKRFRERFRDEMLLTFEEAGRTEGTFRLLLDAGLSVFRQRFFRVHSNQEFPRRAGGHALMSIASLATSADLGLSPYRFFQGGLVSLALFAFMLLWMRVGDTAAIGGLIGRDGTANHALPLTPSDLATIHVECTKPQEHGCPSSEPILDAPPDESVALNTKVIAKSNSNELLLPSGAFGIGRVFYEWPQDRDPAMGGPRTQRRVVFVWYPTSTNEQSKKRFSSVWNYSRGNQLFVQTHTEVKPPIASGSKLFPVLLFYPATNSSGAAYTTQIENLVSHGYVVASIEPYIDRTTISFSNAQLLPFAAELRGAHRERQKSSRADVLKTAANRMLVRQKSLAGDLTFVLDKLTELNQAARDDAPFRGRLDLSRVGAIGHSDGGTAAALACRSDVRISACLSENGWTPKGPNPELDATPSAKPFLWINLPLAPPENEQLVYLHMSRPAFAELARTSSSLAERQLTTTGQEAHRVTVRLPAITDSYFSDGPFIWSMRNGQASVDERNFLVIVNAYARAFFDHYFKGGSEQLLDGSALPFRNVEVRRYGAPAKH